jgi:hypothetical protein
MVRDTARVVGESANAPGTRELRELGCDSAMVMDLNAWLRVFGADGGTPGQEGAIDRYVICGAGLFATPPSCDRVAQTYAGAVGGVAGSFQAMVQRQGRNKPLCAACYDASGARQPCPRGALTAGE